MSLCWSHITHRWKSHATAHVWISIIISNKNRQLYQLYGTKKKRRKTQTNQDIHIQVHVRSNGSVCPFKFGNHRDDFQTKKDTMNTTTKPGPNTTHTPHSMLT